jgi:digeranylgeranylglycerophospholipid reductase
VQTSDEQVKGSIIIGADGIRSYIGRCAGIRTRISRDDIGLGVQFLAHNHNYNNNCISMFLNQTYAPRGYAWIFPKGGNSANVGLCTVAACKVKLPELLNRFVHDVCPSDESAVLEKIIEAAFNKKKVLPASEWMKMKPRFLIGGVPVSRPLPLVVKNNVALAGDAARLANPLTGGGLAAAFVSGYYLGKLCGEIIMTNAPYTRLRLYQRFLNRALYSRLKTQYYLRKMIYDKKRLSKWLYWSLKLSSVLLRYFSGSFLHSWLPKIKGF